MKKYSGAKVIVRRLYPNGCLSDEFIVLDVDFDPDAGPARYAEEMNKSGIYPGLWFDGVYFDKGELIPY